MRNSKYSSMGLFITLLLCSSMSTAWAGEITGTELLLIERACQRLGVRYTHHVDFGKAEKIAELFTEDGVWEAGLRRAEGKAAIQDLFRQRQELKKRISRHVVTNHLVEVLDASHARGVSYIVLFRHDYDLTKTSRPLDNQPVFVGQYEDEYVKTDSGWRFKSRKVNGPFLR